MDTRSDRSLSPLFTTCFFRGVSSELRPYALEMILRQEDLLHLLPGEGFQVPGLRASEYSKLQAGLRRYYGRGARGMLNRIGRRMWGDILRQQPSIVRLRLAFQRRLPRSVRVRKIGEFLAEFMRQDNGRVSLHPTGAEAAYFVDSSSDTTLGQVTEEAVCWLTQGLLQEALHWATGQEYDVEELACRGMGENACRFKIAPIT